MTVLAGSIQIWDQPAATWTGSNPVLLAGQEGSESDTGKRKIGDGVTAWNALNYLFFNPVITSPALGDLIYFNGTNWINSPSGSDVLGTVLTGYVNGSNTPISATDTVLQAFEKLQGQITSFSGIVSGSGTLNYVPKWSSTTAIGNSLIYDNGTNVGISTASPSQKLHVAGNIYTTGYVQAVGAFYGSDGFFDNSASVGTASSADGVFTFYNHVNNNGITLSSAGGANQSYILPTAMPGTSGYVLSSTTGGVLSWAAVISGGGSGTTNRIPLWSSSSALGNSYLIQSGNYVSLDTGKFLAGSDITKTRIDFGTSGDKFIVSTDGATLAQSVIDLRTFGISIYSGATSYLAVNTSYVSLYFTHVSGNKGGFFAGDDTGGSGLAFGHELFYAVTNDAISNAAVSHYATFANAKSATYKAGVTNSIVLGGDGLVAKTNNTAYVNQIGITETSSIEGLIQKTTLTASRTWTLPDKTGTFAMLSDITGGNPFSDASALVKNAADATKLAIFSAASISTATTRTYTLQDASSTLAMYSNNLSVFAATTSAQLAGVISDETGSGALVFGTSPTITTSLVMADAANVVINTTTGTKIGTATTQKLSFYNSTPIVQPTGDVITALQNLGLGASLTISATGLTGTVPLANGGTSASLTASNGGIFYSTASAGAILAGTATANQMLMSGSSTIPSWSTNTWPSTITTNQVLYATGTNAIGSNGNLIFNGTNLTIGGATTPAYTRILNVVANSASDTAMIISNINASGSNGILCAQTTANYAGLFFYGTSYAGSYSGTSIAIAATGQFQSGSTNQLPFVFQGTPIVNLIGSTSTNYGTRLDAVGLRVGQLSTLHTSNTATFQVAAGSTSTVPFLLTSGPLKLSAVACAVEALTDDLYYTITTGAARKTFVLTDGTVLTSGRVPYSTTNGRLIDSSNFAYTSGTGLLLSDNIKLTTAGNGIYVKEGSNATMGTGTLSGGTVTISTTKVTASSRIFITDTGGSNIGSLSVGTITASTSFVVNSTNALDSSTFNWIIIEPA